MESRTNPRKAPATLLGLWQNATGLIAWPRATARAFAVMIFRKLPLPVRNLLYCAVAVMGRQAIHGLPSRLCRYAVFIVWSWITRFRPLLAREPADLRLKERITRRLLNRFLEIPDARYRRALTRLDAHLEGQGTSDAKNPNPLYRGVMMMIGTLGPGGAERQLVVLAKGLHRSLKENIHIACTNLSSPTTRFFLPELEAAGIATDVIGSETDHPLTPSLTAAIEALPSELRDISRYVRTLAAARPEIVHLWLDEVNVKGGVAAVMVNVPKIVLSQRSLPPINFALHQPYMREAYRWLVRQPGVVVINNSAAGARAYEAWLGLRPGSIGVVHNGYEFAESELARYRADCIEVRHRIGIPPNSLVVGAVMRLSEEKCPLLWLEIASQVRQSLPEVRFLIVGDGPLRSTMETRASEPDLAGAVSFAGHLKDSMAAIASMDMLLLTSRAEGLPNVLVEAQFLGVPAIATPAGGAREAVNHGTSGWVLDSWNATSSARQIVRLLQDEKWRTTAAKCGPEFAFARFGIRRAIDETLTVYKNDR